MKIFLVGFMGAGKTHLGKELAALLGFTFLDLDEWMEKQEKRTIAQVFAAEGETEFRKMEAALLRKTEPFSKTIIATGGGAPCFYENMDWMNETGVTIYLHASPGLIAARLTGEKSKRPLIAGLTDEALLHFIQKKIAEREMFYQKAHLQLDLTEDGSTAISELGQYLNRFIRNR